MGLPDASSTTTADDLRNPLFACDLIRQTADNWTDPFSNDGALLEFAEAIFVQQQAAWNAQRESFNKYERDEMGKAGWTPIQIQQKREEIYKEALQTLKKRTCLTQQETGFTPRVLRLAERLKLSEKESAALLYVIVAHSGTTLSLTFAATLSPNRIARAAQFEHAELLHFLNRERKHISQGILGFQESRRGLALPDQKLQMPLEVVRALTGATVSSLDRIKMENTELELLLREEDADQSESASLEGSKGVDQVSSEQSDEFSEEVAAGDDDDKAKNRSPSPEPIEEAQNRSDSVSSSNQGEWEDEERKRDRPYTSDLEYMNDGFKLLAAVVRLRNSESDLKDEDDGYNTMLPRHKATAQLRETRGKERLMLALRASRIKATRKVALAKGSDGWLPRLEQLMDKVGLTPLEVQVLHMLAGNVLSHDVLVAINGRGVMRGEGEIELTVGFVLFMLCETLEERVNARKYFYRNASLLRHGFITISTGSSSRTSFNMDLFEYLIDVDRKLVDYCMGLDTETSEMVQGAKLYNPTVSLSSVVLPSETKEMVLSMVRHYDMFKRCKAKLAEKAGGLYGQYLSGSFSTDKRPEDTTTNENNNSRDTSLLDITQTSGLVFLFHGPSGTGKTMLANAIAHDLNKRLLLITAHEFRALSSRRGADVLRYIFREALLADAIVFFDECESLFGDRESNSLVTSLLPIFETFSGLIILATNTPQWLEPAMNRRISLSVPFRLPDHVLREEIWAKHLNICKLDSSVAVEQLAMEFELSGGLVKNAVLHGLSLAVAREESESPTLTHSDLVAGAKSQLRSLFEELARESHGKPVTHLQPRKSLTDLIAESVIHEELREIVARTKARQTLVTQWGFDEMDMGHQNTVALLHGPSGTGKSLAAEAVAFELGCALRFVRAVDFYSEGRSLRSSRKSSSSTLSVADVFEEARSLGALLVVDDAERLFDGSDSSERISEAIQYHTVKYNKPVLLLATSRPSGPTLSASESRIAFTHEVRFKLPDTALRQNLWKMFVPERVPLAPEGLNIALLAKKVCSAKTIRTCCFEACAGLAQLPKEEQFLTTQHLLKQLDIQLLRESQRRGVAASMFI